jgi:subtilisin family serine protease
MKKSYFASIKPVASLCLSGMALAVLSACGGGSSGSVPVPLTGTCLDGQVDNTMGAEDPFYVNAWHLLNTGATQVVSALDNFGVAGIDANVENVHLAGKGCTGKGVTIAIVDTGMEIGHEDFNGNIVGGKSFNFLKASRDPSPEPNQVKLDHGTGVAGIAAARGWNGLGSRGTAPFASLVAYPIVELKKQPDGKTIVYADPLTTENDTTYLAFGAKGLADPAHSVTTAFGERADDSGIFNYSAGSDYAAPRQVVSGYDTVLELAAKDGTTKLRAGLGAIYFQAAGNAFTDMTGDLPDRTELAVNCASALKKDASILGGELSNLAGMSCGNSNQDPDAKPYFYQVASIHNTGIASSYSSAGAANWITGFGGENGTDDVAIVTSDNSGCDSGANSTANKLIRMLALDSKVSKLIADLFVTTGSKDPSCNYTGTMNGTSAATPSVSGVAALILEANPKLTWQDVGYILAKTARKVDEGIASGKNAVTFTPTLGYVSWNIEDAWIKNTAGFNFQSRYGFGLVDAYAAVKLAADYTAPAGRRTKALSATGTKSVSSAPSSSPNVGLNSSTVQFAEQTATSGALRLDLTITNQTGVDINPGFLQFEIINTETGTKSIVMPAFSSWYVGGKSFPLKAAGQHMLRFQTNAFYGEALKGSYKVYVIDFSGASIAVGKALDLEVTLTSFSM